MRVALVSDLHVDSSAANAEAIPEIVRGVERSGADCLVLAGDVSADLNRLSEVLEAFAVVDVPRFFVPGNHDIWLHPLTNFSPTIDTTTKYDRLIARRAREAGFSPVWRSVAMHEDVAFVGTIGWYDYSFAPEWMGLSRQDYERKQHEGLTWQDKNFVRWVSRRQKTSDRPLTDAQATGMFNDDLRALLLRASRRRAVKRIVVVVHHVPFQEMVRYRNHPRWDYFCAFMGSRSSGEVIRSFEKVTHVLAGHTHVHNDLRVGGLRCVASPLGYLARKRRSLQDEIERAVTLVDLDEA